MPTITPTFDVTALRRAFASKDAAALLSMYADDASIELVDAEHTPSEPRLIRGRDAIGAHLADVFTRDMTHELDVAVATDDALGYTVRCTYGGGTKVLCVANAELRGGRIVREVGVQAWDN